MKIGMLHSIIRPEEKYLIQEFSSRPDIELVLMDDRKLAFNLNEMTLDLDVVLNRSINHFKSLNAMRAFESFGIKCINSALTSSICGDKLFTSLKLREHGIPQPEVCVAFSENTALHAIEKLGFPVVLKPTVGSWGRLLSKINDLEAAQAILEHRKTLGNYQHGIYYIQKYVQKSGRDIRSIVIGNQCVAATYRYSEHWITNAARGANSLPCPITDEIEKISLAAARAVNGEILGIDLFETNHGLLVNEVNHIMEFKNGLQVTGVNIPGLIVDYVISQCVAYS